MGGKISENIYKILILAYAVLISLGNKRNKIENGNILLICSGGLGDGILDAEAITRIARKLNAEGKHLFILAIQPNCEIFSMFLSPSEATLTPCPFLTGAWGTSQKWTEYREITKELRKMSWERIVVRFNRVDIKGMLVALSVPAAQKQAFLNSGKPDKKKTRFIYKMIPHVFDQTKEISGNLTQMQRTREFAKYMGVEQYPITITHLPIQSVKPAADKPYITITVDSNSTFRRWPCENFITLIRQLLKEYSYTIVLTGVSTFSKENDIYRTAFEACDRVKSLFGKTSVKEWIELIRNAEFHIGVDSGSIHVAASVGTQAFCLTGAWDAHRFFPYQIEEVAPKTVEPICIYRQDIDIDTLSCKNCNAKARFGRGNKECHELCKSGRPCLCLEKIEVEDVMKAVTEYCKK